MAPSKNTNTQEHLVFEDNRLAPVLYGEQNAHLTQIEKALNVDISNRGNEIIISGQKRGTSQAKQILEALWDKLQQGQDVDLNIVDSALRFLLNEDNNTSAPAKKNGKKVKKHIKDEQFKTFTSDKSSITTKKRTVQARSPHQAQYIEYMYNNELVFGIGPAGTGKTYLAVAMAVAKYEAGEIERIILSRPAVEAGEHLGFLPGEMKEKMDPYMRPLYDALHDTVYSDKLEKYIAAGDIEIAPLAYMRGRSLNNAFVILDEAQNATDMQMLMFLTRLGQNSRMVITGDPAQTDLPKGGRSGLKDAQYILEGVKDIAFTTFGNEDIVRSKLVSRILDAYDKKGNNNQ